MRCAPVRTRGGASPTVFAPNGRRGKPGKPHARRMHRSRNWRGRGGGSLNRRRQDQASPCPPAHPFLRPAQRAAAGSSSVHSLALEGSALITRAALCLLSVSLSLSPCHPPPPARPSVPSPPPSFSVISLPFSVSLYPTNSMCLFVYSRVLGNTRYASNGASYTRRAARAAACIPILELHPVGSRIPPRLRKTAGWRYTRGPELPSPATYHGCSSRPFSVSQIGTCDPDEPLN